ncbi:MAG: hypothetical protein HC769_16660 [Cyanobacteria bacterium CRU_2_1]|nr:hypothetical protein [Cyanobacteria bacterium RU_5_0]NJR60312.1 hypothetical protein [Cyanobacteria bacterium CRU_2_1]
MLLFVRFGQSEHGHQFSNPFDQMIPNRLALELSDPDRILYLAVPVAVHEAFFQREFLQISVERYQIHRIIYDPVKEVIVQWIS